MTLKDIFDGVTQAVDSQWPDAPIYRGYKPEGFARPSFLLEGGPVSSVEIGGRQRRVTAQVKLTCYTAVDAYGHSGTDELLETADSLMELFYGGYITIGNRDPHITEVTGDYGLDYAAVTVKLEFFEQSLSRGAAGGATEMMEQFHTKMNEE